MKLVEFEVNEIVQYVNDFGEQLEAKIIDKIYFDDRCVYYRIETKYGIPRKMFKNGKGLSNKI